MNTTNREEAQQPASLGMRPLWWRTGGLLWAMVCVGLIVIWIGRRDHEQAVVADDARDTPLVVSRDASADDDAPAPVTVTIPVNSSGNGTQVIDLSEIMGQAKKPVAETPMWDPNGVEDFAFTNHDGQTITKADLLGRPWAICFVFTKCLGPCPAVTRELLEVQDRLKDYDFHLVTLTVDPVRDTPEVLANYAKLNGADPEKWFFLTGDQTEIYGLIHRSFRMPVQEVTGPNRMEGFEIIHSTNVMLVDAEGVVRGKFNAAKDTEMTQLRRELKALAHPLADPASTASDTPIADGRN